MIVLLFEPIIFGHYGPRPAAPAAPGSLFKMHIFRPHPRPTESASGWGLVICVLTSPAGGPDTQVLEEGIY